MNKKINKCTKEKIKWVFLWLKPKTQPCFVYRKKSIFASIKGNNGKGKAIEKKKNLCHLFKLVQPNGFIGEGREEFWLMTNIGKHPGCSLHLFYVQSAYII